MYRLRTLGELTLVDGHGRPVEAVLGQPKRCGLLVYLATHVGRIRHGRDAVMAVLWPDSDTDHSRNSLRQSLHFLRKHLGDDVILNGGHRLSVNDALFSSDVRDFQEAVAEGRFEDALEHYEGQFLQGVDLCTEAGFTQWVEEQRAWIREIAIQSALRAARRAEERGELREAAGWWREASELAPYDEALVRRLVASLVALGNRSRAITVFQSFESRLRQELELEPSAETRARVAATLQTSPAELRATLASATAIERSLDLPAVRT